MDEKQIMEVEFGLNQLISKYRKGLRERDDYRLKCTLEAQNAIKRIGLIMALTGDLQYIEPILDEEKGFGFKIIDANSKQHLVF